MHNHNSYKHNTTLTKPELQEHQFHSSNTSHTSHITSPNIHYHITSLTTHLGFQFLTFLTPNIKPHNTTQPTYTHNIYAYLNTSKPSLNYSWIPFFPLTLIPFEIQPGINLEQPKRKIEKREIERNR